MLRLVSITGRLTALLQAGRGASASLVTAWRAADGRWTCSSALPLSNSAVLATSFGSSGSVAAVLADGRSAVLAGPGSGWRHMPPLPAAPALTITQPPAGQPEVLSADGGRLTVWQLNSSDTHWNRTQRINVPIQYGSSS